MIPTTPSHSKPTSPPPSPQFSPVIEELRRRVSSATERKTPELSPPSNPSPLSNRQVSFQADPYWLSVYQREFFKQDKLFAKLSEHITDNVEKVRDPSEKEIYKLIKNAAYLLQQVPTEPLEKAIKQCVNLNTLKKVLSDKMNEGQMRETLNLVLNRFQEELFNQCERA
jgi:hypothetical protein